MPENFEDIKREIEEKNKLIDKLSRCKKKDSGKIQQLKLELDRLLYIYYKSLTRSSGLKAFL